MGRRPRQFDAVSQRMDELSDAYLTDAARRQAAPGVDEAVRACAAAGWSNGLLTGNSPHRARVKLAGAGIDVDAFDWDRSWFGGRFVRRSDLTAAARGRPGDTTAVILGDTPADGEAADAVGFPFLAVATGAYAEEDLRATSARVVVPDLVEGPPGPARRARASCDSASYTEFSADAGDRPGLGRLTAYSRRGLLNGPVSQRARR